MVAYAGIGSRNINEKERATIIKVARKLSNYFTLYSGNANGSDIAFQEGSDGKCVVMLPWSGFNVKKYDYHKALSALVCGHWPDGQMSVDKHHPVPDRLSSAARLFLARNHYQICGHFSDDGIIQFPPVSFVVCCADQSGKDVKGGTGHAVRIANDMSIPVVNIRVDGWKNTLKSICDELIGKQNG